MPDQKENDTEGGYWGDWGRYPPAPKDNYDWFVAGYAMETLRTPPAEPFFLALGFYRPYQPAFAPPECYGQHDPEDEVQVPTLRSGDVDDLPPVARSWLHEHGPDYKWIIDNGGWKRLAQSYLSSVSSVDSQIGEVLDALDANGVADRTVIALFSDHGWHLGDREHHGSWTLWERSPQVPLIIAGPGIPTGGRIRARAKCWISIPH